MKSFNLNDNITTAKSFSKKITITFFFIFIISLPLSIFFNDSPIRLIGNPFPIDGTGLYSFIDIGAYGGAFLMALLFIGVALFFGMNCMYRNNFTTFQHS